MFIAYEVSLAVIRSLRVVLPQIERNDRDLADQIKRAASSVALNLAEGQRLTKGNKPKHYRRSRTAVRNEVRAALHTAIAWGWIDDATMSSSPELDRLLALLWRLNHPRALDRRAGRRSTHVGSEQRRTRGSDPISADRRRPTWDARSSPTMRFLDARRRGERRQGRRGVRATASTTSACRSSLPTWVHDRRVTTWDARLSPTKSILSTGVADPDRCPATVVLPVLRVSDFAGLGCERFVQADLRHVVGSRLLVVTSVLALSLDASAGGRVDWSDYIDHDAKPSAPPIRLGPDRVVRARPVAPKKAKAYQGLEEERRDRVSRRHGEVVSAQVARRERAPRD